MGVPKFFRYISERYPCLSEKVKEYQLPEFDHLYLDMNGIIHMCSHPDDGDAHFRITEEIIFKDIFHYIEVLFRMIKPRKLFFMAVDGVAPRAKMNQQRGRRFRSVKEAQALETKALERGEVLPTEARFDSNCITPGTVFMARLQKQLKYFVVNKISTDKLWQNCKVVLSGQETPGEGEHKIMDYIRYMRSQPGYDPNTRHCLYGLDADLIMLGLCTHEPHFSLLREEVQFGKKSTKRKNIPEQITFFLLHLSLMREYLELEFYSLKDSLKFNYDMEKIIDDWVLMGFLVGNDFIPNLPNMHIVNGALPVLYNAYMKVLPKLNGYINEAGTLNLERFEIFLQELGNIDIENFREKYADLKWFEGKTGRHLNDQSKPQIKFRKLEAWETEGEVSLDEPLESTDSDLAALIKATNDVLLEPVEHQGNAEGLCELSKLDVKSEMSEEELFQAEFVQHKTDYYMNKLDFAKVTPEVLKSQAEEYIRAIQWNLHYYYNGVCSWSWYYPHHYAPYVSDIKGFSDLVLNFELGTPFQAYEQLLAVLPAASGSLLPEPYQELMVNEDSLIKKYYPEDFQTDLNGKRQEWEAVVLIPFIEEEVLLNAMEPCSKRLSLEEMERNVHGPMSVYVYSSNDFGDYPAPNYFPPVKPSYAKCELVRIEDIRVSMEKLVKGPYPGVKFNVYYPGFPTMKHLKYVGRLEKAKVKVFELPSRNDNMILSIIESRDDGDELPITAAIAKELLGTTIHVGWPHLVEALVTCVSDRDFRYHTTGEKGQYNVEENQGNLTSLWNMEKQGIIEHYKNRLGVDVGITNVLVHVKTMVGRKYIFSSRGRITLEKQWAAVTSTFPLQTIVRDISVYEEKYVSYQDIGSVFPVGSNCFMLGQPCYGIMGEVLDSTETLKDGRIKLCMKKYDEPDFLPVIQAEKELRTRYMNLYVASTKLGISKSIFSRITGSVYITPGRTHGASDDTPKINIGLNLKFNKKNEEVPGYTRKETNTWLYSDKAVDAVYEYKEKFPQVFTYLNSNYGNDVFFEEEMFPDGNAKEIMREITTWIKQQPFYSTERQVCGSAVLDPETTQMIEQVVDSYSTKNNKVKQMVMQVRPHLLFKPNLQMGNLMPDPAATFRLYDRVINVRDGYTVPFGCKGTIIGIHKPSTAKESETLYDVVFDHPFAGGLAINCSPNRGYRMPRPAIINISHGLRMLELKTGKPGVMQAAQNHGNSPRNNYVNIVNSSQNFPPGHFQPPLFPNWSQGCNYSAPPVPNFNYNYNYNPNFNSPHPRPPFNNYSYANSANFNSQGPNTFVPYKSNHFPLSSGVPTQYGPPSMPKAANVNLQGTNVRGLLQRTPNGSEITMRVPHDEKREVKGAPLSKAQALQQLPLPKQPNVALLKSNQAEPSLDQFSKAGSEVLKEILKIDETPSNSRPKPKKENSTPKSVEDFFANARMKEQHTTNYTARLSHEFQMRGLGCPNYQYFEMNKKFLVKMLMPNGVTVLGEPSKSKEEAAENAAFKALLLLQGNSSEQPNVKPPLDAVPEPPRRWQGQPQGHNNQFSPQRSWSKTKAKPENWRTDPKQEKSAKVAIRVAQDQIHKHLKIESSDIGTAGGTEESSSSRSNTSKKQTVSSATFVPLQAVRQHRTKSFSSSTGESSSKQNNSSQQAGAPKEAKGSKTVTVQPEANVPVPTAPSKPRRARKMRIAANFPTTMSPKQ